MKITNKNPKNLEDWLYEISRAYNDAFETILFTPITGNTITSKELFHLGPAICLTIRGIKATKKNLKIATDAALSSYVATEENVNGLFEIPQMAFAFSYLSSHFGLGILDEENVYKIMEYLEDHINELISNTANG